MSTHIPTKLHHIQHNLYVSRDDPASKAHTYTKAAGNVKANKRSRPSKQVDSPANVNMQMPPSATHQTVHTPRITTQPLAQASPSLTSPARSTPGSATKSNVLKALPTVRDHTTDQLGADGDEYLPREVDQDGETKVSMDGEPLSGRKYRCRTFRVPNRGEKLFMLATECARVLGYRDSYLLFNKNRSLHKIIANQAEKDNLIHQEILPYSYRSRQIAIVTARSMFRQFGSRLIESGRRVRDDYWEAKARKQGFTEEDAAGEKRPGAAKAREAAQQEAVHAVVPTLPQGEIIYNNGPGPEGQPPGMGQVSLAPLPMIHLPGDEIRPTNFGNVARPRQEITGPPYHDRTQPSSAIDILTQASQAAEYNKQLSQTRAHRAKYLDDYWARPHEQPTTQAQTEVDLGTVAPQHLQAPQALSGIGQHRAQQDQMHNSASQMMSQGYSVYGGQRNPMTSPVQTMHRAMSSGQIHPNTPMGASAGHRQTPSYGNYAPSQMWQTPQPQPSPLSQAHHLAQYSQQQQQQQHHQSPMPPPQMPGQHSMAYGQMSQMGNPAYAGMSGNMYQTNPSPQQFNMQHNPGQQQGMSGWPGNAGNLPQDWQRYQ